MKRPWAVSLLVGAASLAGGLARAAPLRVVTTTTDLKALTEAVGGDRIAVDSLTSGAQDPHNVEPKPAHIELLREAQLFVRIGIGHDRWVVPFVRKAENPAILPDGPGFVNASKGIALLEPAAPTQDPTAGHVHGSGNPHVWLDPENAWPITANILAGLSRLSPPDAARFKANRAAFLASLRKDLDRWLEAMKPYQGTRVVAYHNSWPYFARRFGVRVVAFVEPKPGVPPSPSHLAHLIQQMQRHQVKALLVEPYATESVVQLVSARSGAAIVRMLPSVGAEPDVRDYRTLFERDIARLTAALQSAGAAKAR